MCLSILLLHKALASGEITSAFTQCLCQALHKVKAEEVILGECNWAIYNTELFPPMQ